MKFGKEKKLKYVEIQVDLPPSEEEALLNFAKKNILEDKKELLNWAITKTLEDYIKNQEVYVNTLEGLVKSKNGTSKSKKRARRVQKA